MIIGTELEEVVNEVLASLKEIDTHKFKVGGSSKNKYYKVCLPSGYTIKLCSKVFWRTEYCPASGVNESGFDTCYWMEIYERLRMIGSTEGNNRYGVTQIFFRIENELEEEYELRRERKRELAEQQSRKSLNKLLSKLRKDK